MTRRLDHSASVALSRRQIREVADQVRRLLLGDSKRNIDVVEALESLSEAALYKWGRLKIILKERPADDPAEVVIDKFGKTLIIDPEIWDLAKSGDPHSRYVLAH